MQGNISSRKELNAAAKEFFQLWKDNEKLTPDEYKQVVKESQKLTSITYPSPKAAVFKDFMQVLLSSIVTDDHPHFAFFKEEEKRVLSDATTSASADNKTGGVNGHDEGDATPAPLLTTTASTAQPLPCSAEKRTLAGLKAHMLQAKRRIEATKAIIRAEESAGVAFVGSSSADEVTVIGESSSSSAVVVLDGFSTAVGATQASTVSSSAFGSVESIVGSLATSVLAPVTTYNGEQVYSGIMLVACPDLPAARKVTELVAEKTNAGAWDNSIVLPGGGGNSGPRVVETKTTAGSATNLRQLGEMIARDRATKVVLSGAASSAAAATGGDAETERQKRGREDGW